MTVEQYKQLWKLLSHAEMRMINNDAEWERLHECTDICSRHIPSHAWRFR